MNSGPNDEVCDATTVDQGTEAGNTIATTSLKNLQIKNSFSTQVLPLGRQRVYLNAFNPVTSIPVISK